jgi:hypothetical protein
VQQISDIVATGANKSKCKVLSKRIHLEVSPLVSEVILKDSKNAAQLTFVAEALHGYFRKQVEEKKEMRKSGKVAKTPGKEEEQKDN